MKNLKIEDNQHDRIRVGAEKSGLTVFQFTNAVIDYALGKLDSGAIQLKRETVAVEESEEVPA